MKYRMLTAVAAAALLAACGGEDRKMSYAEIQGSWADAELFYSFPYHGQANVSLNTPLVLRFSDEVAGKLSPNNIKLVKQSDNSIAEWRSGRPNIVDGGRGMVLYTAHGLTANSEYCVEFDGLKLATGTTKLPGNGFCFNTRVAPDKRGSLAEYGANEALEIAKIFPSLDNSSEPVMDFSTLRVRFNQPVKSSQITYGEQVKLEQGGELVDAVLLVKRNLMTIAPKKALTAGEKYTLTINGVEAEYNDEQLTEKTYSFTPQDSQPRTILAQNTVETRDRNKLDPQLLSPCQVLEGVEDPIKSPLTNQAINCVPMQATLLGDKDSTMQYGDIFAELAFLPNYVEVSPLRVPRGSLLLGTNIDVRVGGVVNANGDQEITVEDAANMPGIMKTGDVSVSFISDATGYLYSNPYSSDPEAPKQVKLFMDLAMTTEGMSPNASLSQNLLHVELNGMASLDGKSMKIDAVGIVEPDVLGTEVAFGFLSFQMKSYPQSDMAEVFAQQVDALKNWEGKRGPKALAEAIYPQEGEALLVNDAMTVHFDAPLDPSTIKVGETLLLTSIDDQALTPADVEWYLDGASVVVKKAGGFKAGTKYRLELTDGITGLPFPKIESGKADSADPERRYFAEQGKGKAIAPVIRTFSVALADDGVVSDSEFNYTGHIEADNKADHRPEPFRYPVILTAYPGYPCAVEWQPGIGEQKTGYCRGDVDGDLTKAKVFPQHVPSNRPLRLTFSKPVTIGEGAIEVFADASNEKVEGALVQNGLSVSFIPKEPWEPGVLYKYVIKTAFDGNCDGVVCGTNGKPLMTAPLAVEVPAEEPINEAPAFVNSEMFFFGTHPTKTVLQSLRNTPTLDPAAVMTYHQQMDDKAKAALEIDKDAEFPNSTKLNFVSTEKEFLSKIITDARVGCLKKGECNDKNYIHLAGNLDTEVFGAVEYQCLYRDGEEEADYCSQSTDIDEEAFGGKAPQLQNGQALAVGIYPTALLAGSVDVFAKVGLTNSFLDEILKPLVDAIAGTNNGWLPSPTGVQVMRMHPGGPFVEEEGNALMTHPLYKNNPNGLIPGWIRNTDLGPVFETRVNLYLDAPYLSVLDGTGSHNQRNYELTLDLRGPVKFLGDGRIQIHQRNLNAQMVSVELGDLTLNTAGYILLEIPKGGAYMLYQGEPVKE